MDVLDMGTGTGILAMTAAKMGANKILAVDNDPSAVVVAQRNIKNNALEGDIQALHGSLKETAEHYDLILANILAPIIITMVQEGLGTRLKQGGRLITSGILDEQQGDVTAAMKATGLTIVDVRKQGDWVAIIAENPL
jgi:ribosomal protein L11 methyltransferase